MPWKVVKGGGTCGSSRWAVIRQTDGHTEGCHATKADAERQQAAKYAQEAGAVTDTLVPDAETLAKAVPPDAGGNCPDGYRKLGDNCVPLPGNQAAQSQDDDEDEYGGKPSEGTPADSRLRRNRKGMEVDVTAFADVDNTPWDGGAAMKACGDAACYGAIAFRKSGGGDPSLRGSWALPHHAHPGSPPNAGGVRGALAALGGARGANVKLADPGAARNHLDAHMATIRRAAESADMDVEEFILDHDHDFQDGGDVQVDLTSGRWRGVLTVEGRPTGDGRQFARDALVWQDLPLTLTYQPPSHGGQSTDGFVVGNITKIWRDGDLIRGEGNFDLGDPDAANVARQVGEHFLKGISVDVDDVKDADVELVFPDVDRPVDEAGEPMPDGLMMLFGPPPELVIFHKARIRSAAVVSIPAFIEATIELVSDGDDEDTMVAAVGVVGVHPTTTSDAAWDGQEHEGRLPNMLPLATARRMYVYVYAAQNGMTTKLDCRMPHHEVSNLAVGPANLTACATHLGELNRRRGHLPPDARRGVYEHLAAHLRAAGKEAPPLVDDALVAHGALVDGAWRPPRSWFADPKLSVPIGITVSDEGRIYGHAAQWGTCHVGYPGECVPPPREDDGHPFFLTGEVVCDDGSRVSVGQITLDTVHPSLYLGASEATAHYDDTGTAVADVVVGNDEHGIWVAGAVRPDADHSMVRALRASGQVSGDWRRIGSQLRLIGLLAVNEPGFPVPRTTARVASGRRMALVAAGRINVAPRGAEPDAGLRRVADILALRIGRPVTVGAGHGEVLAPEPKLPTPDELAARVHPEEVTVDA